MSSVSLNDNDVSLIPSICRLSKENSNDAQPSSIDWFELIEAVNKIQKQSCKYMVVSLILRHFFMTAAISIFIWQWHVICSLILQVNHYICGYCETENTMKSLKLKLHVISQGNLNDLQLYMYSIAVKVGNVWLKLLQVIDEDNQFVGNCGQQM